MSEESKEKPYIVVLKEEFERSAAPLTYTAFPSKESFEKWRTTPVEGKLPEDFEKVVAHGISEESAKEMVMTAQNATHALAAAVRPGGSRRDVDNWFMLMQARKLTR